MNSGGISSQERQKNINSRRPGVVPRPAGPKVIGKPVGNAEQAQADRGIPAHLRGRANRDARRAFVGQRRAAKHSLKAASRQLKGMNRSPMAGSKPGVGIGGNLRPVGGELTDNPINAVNARSGGGTAITPSFGGGPLPDKARAY